MGTKKFASNTSLFCCSKNFSEKDYRKSLAGKRCDLVKKAVPSIFPWSVGNDEVSERSKRAKSRECQRIQICASPSESMENKHYLYDAPDISEKETQGKDSDQKPLKEERDFYMPRVIILNKSCFFQNLVWRGLDRMMMTYFSTKDFGVTEL